MKKMLIGVFTAALIAIPATAFAAQPKTTTETPVAVESQAVGCCVGGTGACCTVAGGSSCCN